MRPTDPVVRRELARTFPLPALSCSREGPGGFGLLRLVTLICPYDIANTHFDERRGAGPGPGLGMGVDRLDVDKGAGNDSETSVFKAHL